ncbi:MAG: DUF4143 domain-containing protein [Planctomycetota bacterium]
MNVERLLQLPDRSFFLFGPRGVGKSHLLRARLAGSTCFDLLNTGLQLEFARNPSLLEARAGALPRGTWIWIDEVQKVPAILDEVHRLMELKRWRFALSGSSARKLHRQDLLAGRASTRHLEGFSFAELGRAFDRKHVLEWGSLPLVVNEPEHCRDILAAYVHTYIKEEIKEEGLVRKIEPFLRFLEVAGMLNGQIVNFENIGREAQVPRKSVVQYFSILEDTLVAHRLPSYQPQVKVKEVVHPKYYWFDQGVARAAANLLNEPVDATWTGVALETLVYHELRVYHQQAARGRAFFYYRTGGGAEIDFIVQLEKQTPSRKARVVCLEVKSAKRWKREWEAAMRGFHSSEKLHVERMIGVYLGDTVYHFDGVDVMPLEHFLTELFAGRLY